MYRIKTRWLLWSILSLEGTFEVAKKILLDQLWFMDQRFGQLFQKVSVAAMRVLRRMSGK